MEEPRSTSVTETPPLHRSIHSNCLWSPRQKPDTYWLMKTNVSPREKHLQKRETWVSLSPSPTSPRLVTARNAAALGWPGGKQPDSSEAAQVAGARRPPAKSWQGLLRSSVGRRDHTDSLGNVSKGRTVSGCDKDSTQQLPAAEAPASLDTGVATSGMGEASGDRSSFHR